MDIVHSVCYANDLSYYIIYCSKMKKCDCYREETKTRYPTEFERGLSFGMLGKWLDPNEPIEYKEGRCLGTRECETCTCRGDTSKCDFYPEKRNKKKSI